METVLVYGFINSSILVVMALGFSLALGVSGIPNLAHGAFFAAAGFLSWIFAVLGGLPLPVAILLAILLVGLFGMAMYVGFLERTKGLELIQVLATLAIGIAILEFLRWKFGASAKYHVPLFIEGEISIFGVGVDYQRIIIVLGGLFLFLLIYLFTHFTKVGLAFRAIAQDEYTALCLGMRSDWTSALSITFGSALGALAGTMILPLLTVTVDQGYDVLLMAMAVAVVGGLESLPGMLIACFVLGYAQTITAYFNPHWIMIVYLAAVILVLVFKPSGLLGRFKELEERI